MKFPACIIGALLSGAFAAAQENPVRLNQSGFYTAGPKQAAVMGPVPSDLFFITTPDGNDTVFRGVLQPEKLSQYSASRVRMADFSALEKKGRFVLRVPGMAASYPFGIGDAPYRDLAAAVLKGFYFQRASMPLEARYAGKWARPAGHPDTRVLVHPSAADGKRPAGTVIASPGGWYDAGDYNKYIVNSGITMYMLLSAYEIFPAYFDRLDINIPESGNGVPDILDESLYNLRWMLTMQDPNDGGVYHKCTNAGFDKMVMPHNASTQPRYVVQKSSTAAYDFAAVMAMASRIYRPFEDQFPGLADSCSRAAVRAWDWAERHTGATYLYNQKEINRKTKPAIQTGEYGDRNSADERFWAYMELVTAVGGQKFDSTDELHTGYALPNWYTVETLGHWSAYRHPAKPLHKKGMGELFIRQADQLIRSSEKNAFGTVMGQTPADFNWGGNSNAATQGILLVYAYLATQNRIYLDHALSNLDYLLGRNATGYCFVTGFGEKRPMHPHHRPSVADGVADPVPGLLVGGPNIRMEDGARYPFREVETAYVDRDSAFACNEVAINWNAPLVFLVNALEALKVEAGYVKE
ncbi:glycoside hydrolase family 9 protein [Chitinophaga sp. NPDC101104]|uniref:glycoside hydrolase family 9 protein n=1 Tax=Chitinophaga sp. NPDC101104 TaxID=3390561 RepID=UPI003D02E7C3